MTSTYERPTWRLMKDASGELPQTFSTAEMIAWFAQRYSLLKENTVRLHLRGMSVNVAAAFVERWPDTNCIFYKLSPTEWTHYDPAVHGIFDHGRLVGDDDPDDEGDPDAELSPTPDSLATEFALESHLEEFMAANWDRLEFGVPLVR